MSMNVDQVVETEAWKTSFLAALAANPLIGYRDSEPPAAEPVAIAALTACGYGIASAAQACCSMLQRAQAENGSVSVHLGQEGPFWTTALACVAWQETFDRWGDNEDKSYTRSIDRALKSLLRSGGEAVKRTQFTGHNSELVGWPWVEGTHSWLEPTAFALMALRRCGYQNHPRARDAASLLLDRQLPDGGANYGNTEVLGQTLRPHIHPTAISALALQRLRPQPAIITKSLAYLCSELGFPMAAASLGWTLHALAAYPSSLVKSSEETAGAIRNAITRLQSSPASTYRGCMIAMAMLGTKSPLLALPEWEWTA